MDNLPTDKNIENILEARAKLQFKQDWETFLEENEAETENINTPLSIETTSSKSSPLSVWSLQRWAIAASIALVIGLGTYWAFSGGTEVPATYAALATQYEDSFDKPHLDYLKGGSEEDIKAIRLAYAKSDFSATLTAIQKAFPEEIPDKFLKIRGYCHYQTANYSSAINDFEQFVSNAKMPSDEVLWYLALAYLKKEPASVEKAQGTLEKLQKEYDSKDEEVADLLKVMKKM